MPVSRQGVSVPSVGQSLRCLIGELVTNEDDLGLLTSLEPPEAYNVLLRAFSFTALMTTNPLDTFWTQRALSWNNFCYSLPVAWKHKYKPVDRKVQPVPTYMPDPAGQVFKTIIIPELAPLPLIWKLLNPQAI